MFGSDCELLACLLVWLYEFGTCLILFGGDLIDCGRFEQFVWFLWKACCVCLGWSFGFALAVVGLAMVFPYYLLYFRVLGGFQVAVTLF